MAIAIKNATGSSSIQIGDDDILHFYRANNEIGQFNSNGLNLAVGKGLVDADDDTYITVEKTADEDIIHFYTAGSERVTISENGLNVYDNDDPKINILTGNVNTGSSNIFFGHPLCRKVAIIADYINNWYRADLHFAVDTAGDGNSVQLSDSKMMIDGLTGNVGIGTTNPTEKLHVNGSIRIPTASSEDDNSPGIVCVSNDDFLYDGEYLNHYGLGWHYYDDGGGNGRNAYLSGFFGIDLFTNGQNRLRINRNGNVGIGVTNPGYRLDINTGLRLQNHPTSTASANAIIAVNPYGVFYRSTSSIKYKTDIQNIDDDDNEKLFQLKPRKYYSKLDKRSFHGLIADEVAEVEPEWVKYNENNEPDGIEWNSIIAVMLNIIRKMRDRLNDLQEQINDIRQSATEGFTN